MKTQTSPEASTQCNVPRSHRHTPPQFFDVVSLETVAATVTTDVTFLRKPSLQFFLLPLLFLLRINIASTSSSRRVISGARWVGGKDVGWDLKFRVLGVGQKLRFKVAL